MSEPVFGFYGPSREMEHPPLGHKQFPDRSLVLIERMIHRMVRFSPALWHSFRNRHWEQSAA